MGAFGVENTGERESPIDAAAIGSRAGCGLGVGWRVAAGTGLAVRTGAGAFVELTGVPMFRVLRSIM